jgi:23S rRNA (pseudouridine1915-N3)-methyltransferase
MKIKLLVVGKTEHKGLQAMILEYQKRLKHYIKFELEVIPALKATKNMSVAEQQEKEGEAILARISSSDMMFLLDEQGKQYASVDFANYLQKLMNAGTRQLVFVVGGPYGEKCLTESSGGINEKTIRNYAECGVNYISSGALTHSVSNKDLSLKAV